MAKAKYRAGEKIIAKYTAGADIAVGDVVILGVVNAKKSRIGVAVQDIANGATGDVCVSGTWLFPKATAAVIKAGEAVGWDADPGEIDDNALSTAVGDVAEFGCALQDAGSGVLEILVDISHPGTYDGA